MRRRVTFSRNLTLSLSRTCRCYCKYCAFATHRSHLHAPEEVLSLLDGAARRNVKELLVLTGERPDADPQVLRRLQGYGHDDFTAYVAWACERALERGLLPHTNLGVLEREDLARLREVTASQGLMLESINPDLVAHQGSPSKHPAERLRTIRTAGELAIPFTSGILVGIGETAEQRIAALAALAEVHAERSGQRLPVNGAGAGGAALVDLGLPPSSVRGFVLIGRTAGLVAHLVEEAEHPIGMPLWLELQARTDDGPGGGGGGGGGGGPLPGSK